MSTTLLFPKKLGYHGVTFWEEVLSRIMAVDPGSRRIGIAITDPLRILASPLTVIELKPGEDPVPRIARIVAQYAPEIVVVGNPIGLDGQETMKSRQSRALVERLHKTVPDVKWVLWDERLSTVEASGLLHEAGKNSRKQKAVIDAAAAAVILRSYLNHLGEDAQR